MPNEHIQFSEKENKAEIVLLPFAIDDGKVNFDPNANPDYNTYSFEGKDILERSTLCYSTLQDSIMKELEVSSEKLKETRNKSLNIDSELIDRVKITIKGKYEALLEKYSSNLYENDFFVKEKVIPVLKGVIKDTKVLDMNVQNHIRRTDDAKFIKENVLIGANELPSEHINTFKAFLVKTRAIGESENSLPLDTFIQWRMAHKVSQELDKQDFDQQPIRIIGPGTDPNFTKDKSVVYSEDTKMNRLQSVPHLGDRESPYDFVSKGYDTSKFNVINAVAMLTGVKPLSKSNSRDMTENNRVIYFDPLKEFGAHLEGTSFVGFCGSEQALLLSLGLAIGREPLHGGDISDISQSKLIKYISPDGKVSDPIKTNCEHSYFMYCSLQKQDELKQELLKENSGIYIASFAGEESFLKEGEEIQIAIDYLQHNSKEHPNRDIVSLSPNNMVHAAFVIREGKLVNIVTQDHRDGANVNKPEHQRELFEIMEKFNASKGELKDKISIAVSALIQNAKKQNFSALTSVSNTSQKRPVDPTEPKIEKPKKVSKMKM
ncbi:hypothetical protein OAC88_03185 [Flavobacteriaceae bacterium]|nr:hypothetical protein [Flavobacteriaceae bacterium]